MVQPPQLPGLVLAPNMIVSANPSTATFTNNRVEWQLSDLAPGQTRLVECSLGIMQPPDPFPDGAALSSPLHSMFKAQTVGISLSKVDLRCSLPEGETPRDYELKSQKVQKRYRVTIKSE